MNKFKEFLAEEVTPDISTYLVDMLSAVSQFHSWHLTSKTLDEHDILGDYYDKLQGLVDAAIESYLSNNGIFARSYDCVITFYDNTDAVKEKLKVIKNDTNQALIFIKNVTNDIPGLQDTLVQIAKETDDAIFKMKMV